MTTTAHATSRGFKHWNDRDDATIREMFREGYTDDVIASALGRTVKAIELRRIRLNLRNSSRPKSAPSGPRPLTSGQLAEIQRHLDSGLGASEISALMSLPERTVQQAIGNHHMIAMPPRNVYRPPAVRTLAPDIVPAPEPFERRRMLHPDAPVSMPVPAPQREDDPEPGKVLMRNGDGSPALVGRWGDTTGAVIQAGGSTPIPSIAEDDWEPYTRAHAQITGMVVVLRKGGKLALSQDAWQAIGAPERVALLYSRRRNSIGIRPSSDPNQPKVQRDGRMGEINAVGFARQFALAFEGQRVEATVEQGTLVVEVGA